MEHKIKVAFDQIHADDSLKETTKAAIERLTKKQERKRRAVSWRYAVSIACMLVLMIGGFFSYTIPVAAVSLDINPSVELSINIYDKVIDVKGYNEAGLALVDDLAVDHMTYLDAIKCIVESEAIAAYRAEDDTLEVTVSSWSQSRAVMLQTCIADQTEIAPGSVHCTQQYEDVEAAHEAGISFGKYRAYLELQEIRPDVTIEDIQGFTMREIRDLMTEISCDQPAVDQQETDQADGSCTGTSSGYGNGNGQGSVQGQEHGHRHGQ